ncbi:MAG: metallophosphoesterase family protein [Candidatus Electrothrix sp. YB6]
MVVFGNQKAIQEQLYYARQIQPGLRFIGLDACLPEEKEKWGGIPPEEQLQWLDRELTAHADQLHLLFMHHNVIRWSPDEAAGGPKQWFCIDNDAEVKKLLAKHAQTAPVVLSGHRHIGLHAVEENQVHYFVLPSLAAVLEFYENNRMIFGTAVI